MIRVYVQQIQQALQSKLYFPALALTLALPDMCGMAEYPNKSVAERYILWYDQYISPKLIDDEYDKDTPYMSGELVYNLRNTLLHQGSPSICFEKVKDDANTDPIVEMLNEKIRQSDENVQLKGSVLKVLQNVSTAEMIENNKIFRGDKIIAYKMSFMPHREEKKVNTDDKAKEEHRFRCFFGRAFKDSPYKAYKEDIVKAVLASKTKMELNNSLMKLLPGEAVKEVLKNLKPYIKDWPGQ